MTFAVWPERIALKLAESLAKRNLLLLGQVLVTQENDLVLEQRVVDCGKFCVRKR